MDQQQSAHHLKKLKLKVTPQRLEVMHCMASEPSYLSADEVWSRVKPILGSLGLPTVYRILDELTEAGVVSRIFRSDRKQYYHLCPNQSHHHHFVCETCRRVEDVDVCGLDGVAQVIRRTGASVTSHILQINGVCGECIKREEAANEN